MGSATNYSKSGVNVRHCQSYELNFHLTFHDLSQYHYKNTSTTWYPYSTSIGTAGDWLSVGIPCFELTPLVFLRS